MHRTDVRSHLSMTKGEVTQGKNLNEERSRRLVLWDNFLSQGSERGVREEEIQHRVF